jgi:hypothetical protein
LISTLSASLQPFIIANQPILPAALLAQLNQARAVIPPAYREKPCEGSIISDIAAAYIYIND